MVAVLLCTCLGLLAALVDSRRRAAARLAEVRAEHAEQLTELGELALHDPLTGLPNRLLLQDRLRHALSRRTGGVGVLFLDLDGFKGVNDGYGHAVGDAVLTTVARRLQAAVRLEDTPARLAGDEFVVVCEGVEDSVSLAAAAARLEAVLSAPMDIDGRRVCLGVSIGAALHTPDPQESPALAAARLLVEADTRMYDGKRARQLRVAELGLLNQLAARSVPVG
ncbi:MAG: GGDEF domain-containing protein [Mycobacteriales bacterium]